MYSGRIDTDDPQHRTRQVRQAMADTVSREKRSEMMSRVRGKNTKPELLVRSGLHRRGLRFSLHRKTLPGTPDIVLSRWRTVVFVHGCFWHRHGCRRSKLPATNVGFWDAKLRSNAVNDERHRTSLERLGWKVLYVWECELKDKNPRAAGAVIDRIESRIRERSR